MKPEQTSTNTNGSTLHDHLLQECVAMAKYALASGLKVPPGMMQTLDNLSKHQPNGGNGVIPADHPAEPPAAAPNHNSHNETVRQLTQIHIRLADLLVPASPRTVLLLENESRTTGIWGFLGPVGLVRRMMAAAIIFLVALIALSISPLIDTESINQGIFQADGMSLLVNMLFLLTAAGLGACFAGLFQANRYISDASFDPKFESSYWVRLVLGLMAGMILAELVPLDFLGGGEGEDAGHLQALGKPVLALLGGFSAAAVYRIINRIVEALESVVRGDVKDVVAARDEAHRARYQSQLTETRLGLAASLSKVQQQISSGADPDQVKQELDRLLNNLVPSGSIDEDR
jgi:hypothetical protein